SDSIPLERKKRDPVFKVLSVASLLGEAIRRIHNEESVSSLFN
ncbi:MAG: phosphoribosylpyrophosphate synthetase, partial [Candidatus Omnitrophica bacterium CG07_land_8_20_14_0_80_50_8]